MNTGGRRDVRRLIARRLLGVLFLAGGVAHLILGRLSPAGYADFARSAPGPLRELWLSFVMPNIAVLTLLLAGFEIAVAVGWWLRGSVLRTAAWATAAFLIFIVVLGSGFPVAWWGEDLLKNRLPAFVLLLAALYAGRQDAATPPV